MAAEAVGVAVVLALALAAAAAAAAAPRLRLVVTAPRWAFVERPLLLSPASPRFVPRRGMVLLLTQTEHTCDPALQCENRFEGDNRPQSCTATYREVEGVHLDTTRVNGVPNASWLAPTVADERWRRGATDTPKRVSMCERFPFCCPCLQQAQDCLLPTQLWEMGY